MKAVVWSKPACPYCTKAKNLLKTKGIEYEEKNIAEGHKIQDLLELVPNAKTMPQISSSRPLLKRWSSRTTELPLRARVVISFCLLGVQMTACWRLYLVQLGELRPTTPSFARHGHETKVPIRLSDSGANTPCANNLRGFLLAEKPHHCA